MNKPRRKAIDKIMDTMQELQEELSAILEEEEEYRDNMPENLWNSERYATAEEACDNLQAALDSMEETIDYLDEAKGE